MSLLVDKTAEYSKTIVAGKSEISSICSALSAKKHMCRLCHRFMTREYDSIKSHLRFCHKEEGINVGIYLEMYYNHIEDEEAAEEYKNKNTKKKLGTSRVPDKTPRNIGNNDDRLDIAEFAASCDQVEETEIRGAFEMTSGCGFACLKCGDFGVTFATFDDASSHIRKQHGPDAELVAIRVS